MAADGDVVLDGAMPPGTHSYRALRRPWAGHPTDRPAIAVEAADTGSYTAFVSGNGATEVDRWQAVVRQRSQLVAVGSVPKDGFETQFTVTADQTAAGRAGPGPEREADRPVVVRDARVSRRPTRRLMPSSRRAYWSAVTLSPDG